MELLALNPLSPYRRQVQSALINAIGIADNRVDNIAAILQQLIVDVDDGLLDPIEAQARSVVFRDFLDHAEHTTFEAAITHLRALSLASCSRTPFAGRAIGTRFRSVT